MFVLLPEGQEVAGAGLATMLSNAISLCYFLLVFFRLRKYTVGLYGLVWSQPVSDTCALLLGIVLYRVLLKKTA